MYKTHKHMTIHSDFDMEKIQKITLILLVGLPSLYSGQAEIKPIKISGLKPNQDMA